MKNRSGYSTAVLFAGLFVAVAGISYNLPQAQANIGVEGVSVETGGKLCAWLLATLPGLLLKAPQLFAFLKSRGVDTGQAESTVSLVGMWLMTLGGDKVAEVSVTMLSGQVRKIDLRPFIEVKRTEPPSVVPSAMLAEGGESNV